MISLGDCYKNRRVLITGHTGFKGSWLALWLESLGAEVTGIALPPETRPSHWESLGLGFPSLMLDIRDATAVTSAVRKIQPEIVFHLAAQPLVRRSYREPVATWETNVMGTAHLMEACRPIAPLKAIVVVTSDKCYENREQQQAYRESDPLGGHDPYSASKAATELVVASYRRSFFNETASALLATARAGNVIGGGDWSEDRLIPDAVRAVEKKEPLEIRSPAATRPWQHVLEPLHGYLLLGERLLEGRRDFAAAWNFGPDAADNRTVADVLEQIRRHWPALSWHVGSTSQPHEATLLQLDSTCVRRQLNWRPCWGLETAVEMTAAWYRAYLESGKIITRDQLATYQASLARQAA